MTLQGRVITTICTEKLSISYPRPTATSKTAADKMTTEYITGGIYYVFDKLIDRIKEMKNPTVAGLDPNFSYVPEYIREKYASIPDPLEAAAKAVLEYNYGLIDALCDIVPAVKPQAAYYEMYGWYGMKTFAETISYAQSKGMYVIADCKRNDIGSTMEAYSTAHLGEIELYGKKVAPFGADALTVNE